MKKFGTPTGAGPGNAKLNVGLAAVGTPPAVWVACGLGLVVNVEVLLLVPLPGPELPLPLPFGLTCPVLVEGWLLTAGRPGLDPVRVDEDDEELLELELELVELEVDPVLLDVVVVLEVDAGWHSWVTAATGPATSECGSTEPPGGTLTSSKVRVWPPTSVIVTRQRSAEAGIEAIPNTVKVAASDPRTTRTRRRRALLIGLRPNT